MKTLKLLLATCTACVALLSASCNKDDNKGPWGEQNYVDFVTVESLSQNGASFTFRKENDSPLVTLTSSQSFNTSMVKPGERIVMNYIPESGNRYESGSVRVLEAVSPEGKGQEVEAKTSDETDKWASDRVSMFFLQRSGMYVNMIFTAMTVQDPKECALYVDSETIGTDTPTLHLVFEAGSPAMGTDYYFYASYSIAELWNNPQTKKIRVYYPDIQSTQPYTDFVKVVGDDQERPQ